MKPIKAIFFLALGVGFARCAASDAVPLLTPADIPGLPVCIANYDVALAFQNDMVAVPSNLATVGVPQDLAGTPVGIVGGAIGGAIANEMIRAELFGPREPHMPMLIRALGEAQPGEVVEAAAAGRFADLGASEVHRIDAADGPATLRALEACVRRDERTIVVVIRWSLADDLRQLQLLARAGTYLNRRDFLRERPERVVEFAASSARVAFRQKTVADIEHRLAVEAQRFESSVAPALIAKVNREKRNADPRDRRRAALLQGEHQAAVRRARSAQWDRRDLLAETTALWSEGEPSRLHAQAISMAERTVGLVASWGAGELPPRHDVPPTPAILPPAISGELGALQARQSPDALPRVAILEGGGFDAVMANEHRLLSSQDGHRPELGRIGFVIVDDDWFKQASQR